MNRFTVEETNLLSIYHRGIFFQDHFQLQALQLLQSSTLHRSPHEV